MVMTDEHTVCECRAGGGPHQPSLSDLGDKCVVIESLESSKYLIGHHRLGCGLPRPGPHTHGMAVRDGAGDAWWLGEEECPDKCTDSFNTWQGGVWGGGWMDAQHDAHEATRHRLSACLLQRED